MIQPKTKLAEPKIDLEDPWKDDKLNRKESVEALTKLLEEQTTALTISINGEWGSGKTFMLKRWQQQLKNENYTAIYFNAWEDDFIEDPLIAIIGQLWLELDCKRYDDELTGKMSDIKRIIIPFLKKNGKNALKIIASKVIQKATADIVDVKSFQELEETAENTVCDDYISMAQTRNILHTKLTDLANSIYHRELLDAKGKVLSDADGKKLTAKKPLVFIIDELDRCRPTFAIEVLERTKHLFNIDHMIFVLGIDRKQLGESIKAVYGNIATENYLHRFIDLDFCIPPAAHEIFFESLWEEYNIPKHLNEKREIGGTGRDKEDGASFKQVCCTLFSWHDLSLREMEQCIKLYTILLRSTPARHFSWPFIAAVLILLKLRNPSLYHKYLTFDCSVADVVDFIVVDSAEKDKWAENIIPAAIYSSFFSDYPITKNKEALHVLFEAMYQGQPISQMPLVAKCLKLKNAEELKRFANTVSEMQSTAFQGNAAYNRETFKILINKIELIYFEQSDR